MQRPVYYRYAVIAVVTVLLLQQDSAAFHPTLLLTVRTTSTCSGRTNQYYVRQKQQPLRSTVDNDNVMSAFDQAFAKLKGEGSPPPVNPAENLQNVKMEIVSNSGADTDKANAAALPNNNNNNTKKIWKPQPPQTDPPKNAYRQQQLGLQSSRTKNAVAVAASKRTLTTASTPAPSSKVGTTQMDPKQQNKLFYFGRSTAIGKNGLQNGPEQSQQQPLHNLNTAEPERLETNGAAASSLASSSSSSTAPSLDKISNKSDLATAAAAAAPSAVEDASVETRPKQQKAERQVVSTIGGRMTVVPESKMNISQSFATWQSWFIGAFIGVAAVTPITLLHHFYFYPSYESLAQWEYDTGAALVQGAVFAAVYRYAIREDWDEEKLGKAVFMAFFLVRSLVGIHVPMSCSTPFLFCAEPLPFADWDMVRAFAMSAAESYVLFGAVAGTMDLLLRNSVIRPFK